MYRATALARIPSVLLSRTQRWSSSLSPTEQEKVKTWITSQKLPVKQPSLTDYINSSRLEALGSTLPSLDGSVSLPPHHGHSKRSVLPPGHILVFCNPSAPERELELDATIRVLSPPAPFVRRMWASGKFEFRHPVHVGDNIRAQRGVSNIVSKRLDSINPMIIVEQTIETTLMDDLDSNETSTGIRGPTDVCIIEKRSHVYIPLTNEHRIATVEGLPQPDFSFSYTPTDTTLFRFSALTFNAHRVHIDKEYAQNVEKLPERLVHGPMTALMLMEVIELNRQSHLQIASFEYRATNPLFVSCKITIYGRWREDNQVQVWAQSEDGVVGMIGAAHMKAQI